MTRVCPVCKGVGLLKVKTQRTMLGYFRAGKIACDACDMTGSLHDTDPTDVINAVLGIKPPPEY